MNELQKYLFDVRGWMLIPGVLTDEQVASIKKHVLAGGDGYTGPAAELLNHPALVPVLRELLDSRVPESEGPDYYPFRCENCFISIREQGSANDFTGVPHNVGRANSLAYQCEQGRMYSSLTRVVWELNPVRRGMGGTQFLSGSHKANFALPEAMKVPGNENMESYECPAGSLFVFCESLLHASARWTDPRNDRIALFYAYNSIMSQYHKLNVSYETIEAMPAARQSLFRGVYYHEPDLTVNKHFTPTSRSIVVGD